MARRLRREFQGLESLLEPDVQAKQWRALIDKVLYDKGRGPKPIVEQLRLREKLRTLHARRDRYNQVRRAKRIAIFRRLLIPQHVIAMMAIRIGLVEAAEGALPRNLLIGAMAGDRRLSLKLLEELDTIYETTNPTVPPWEIDQRRIVGEEQAEITTRHERMAFEQALKPTPLPVVAPAEIPFGYPVFLPRPSDAPESQVTPPAARAAS